MGAGKDAGKAETTVTAARRRVLRAAIWSWLILEERAKVVLNTIIREISDIPPLTENSWEEQVLLYPYYSSTHLLSSMQKSSDRGVPSHQVLITGVLVRPSTSRFYSRYRVKAARIRRILTSFLQTSHLFTGSREDLDGRDSCWLNEMNWCIKVVVRSWRFLSTKLAWQSSKKCI